MRLRSYMYNVQNSLFASLLRTLNLFATNIVHSFYTRIENAEMLIFTLLAVYILLVAIQVPLGCFLLRTVHVEEELFLKVPSSVSRRYQKVANGFVASIKVFPTLSQ